MNFKRVGLLSLFLNIVLSVVAQCSTCFAIDAKILSENGSGRATGYIESNKIITSNNKTHVAWLDSFEDGFRAQIKTLDQTTGIWSDTFTLGEGEDNHGGPALTIDSEGYLHAVYFPHHEPFRYRKSLKPNDASAWTDEVMVGDKLTYPSLVTGPDDTLYLIARVRATSPEGPWGVNLYTKPKNGDWSAPTEILRAGQAKYSQFQATLAWGPDHKTLHMSTRMYGDDPMWAYQVGYMQSTDFGQSWRTSGGTDITLPATKNSLDTIVSIDPSLQSSYSSTSALRAGSMAVDKNNVPYVVYNTLGPNETGPLQAWLATPSEHGGWNKILLNNKIEALPAGWGLGAPGGLTFTDDGRMSLVLTAYADGFGWGNSGSEVLGAVSGDGGATFSSQFISDIDSDTPHWLPSIERATGFNEVDSLAVIYTSGFRGDNNTETLKNQVIFSLLPGLGWNGVSGDVNQDGVFSGDGTGPADLDDVTAFIENWLSINLPGALGTYDSMTHGDMNFDGTTDLDDVFLLRQVMLESGVSTSALARLAVTVPEPKSVVQLIGCVVLWFGSKISRT